MTVIANYNKNNLTCFGEFTFHNNVTGSQWSPADVFIPEALVERLASVPRDITSFTHKLWVTVNTSANKILAKCEQETMLLHSWRPSNLMWHPRIGSTMDQVMLCGLFVARPLPEAMLTYKVGHLDETLVKFQSQF